MNRITCGISAAIAVLISTNLWADWSMPLLNAGHVTWRPEVAVTANVINQPAWRAGTDIAAPIAPCVVGNTVYAVAQTGEDWYITEPVSCRIEARKTADGSLIWVSSELDTDSVSESTLSGITADNSQSSLFFATGSTLYSLSMANGTIKWQTSIADAVTTFTLPGASATVVNASPAINDDMVFINTRDYSSTGSVLLAYDKATGAPRWQALNVSTGLNSPLAVTVAGTPVVFTPYSSDGFTGAIQCFDAATGNIKWRSAWETSALFWADLVYADNCIYGVTYDYAGVTGNLVCANATDGQLKWKVDAPFSDTTPLVAENAVYIAGGAWGAGKLCGYSLSDGTQLFEPVALRANIFRNNMAASANRLFLSANNRIYAFGFDGVKIAESAADFYNASIVLDSDGSLYATAPDYATQTQELVKFEPLSAVDDWQILW